MFDLWLKHWRRRRLARRPIPPTWSRWLHDDLWQFRSLTDRQRQRLLHTTQFFYHEKNFEGCQGLALDDRMKVVIGGAASLLLLGFDDDYCFDRVRSVLVYPGTMRLRGEISLVGGSAAPEPWAAGVYSSGDTIVLSWEDVAWDCGNSTSGANVVIHELAHHVDDLDGTLDGDPPFATSKQSRDWRRLIQVERDRLANEVAAGVSTVLRPYALTNLAEFFAVACEAFYCDARALAQCHSALFSMLQTLFRFDPRSF